MHALIRIRFPTLCLIAILVAGFSLRFVGMNRGDSPFPVSGKNQSEGSRAFYHFHPDETTLIKSALGPIDPPYWPESPSGSLGGKYEFL